MAHHNRKKKGLVFGFATAATALAMASAAFACTNFKGEVTLHTSSNPTLTTTAHGLSQSGGMTYCNHDGNPGSSGVNAKGTAGGTGEIFTVSGNSYTCTASGGTYSFLVPGSGYSMFAAPGKWVDNSPGYAGNTDCMDAGVDRNSGNVVTLVGTNYTIPSPNGGAWGPFTSTTPYIASVGPVVVCFDTPSLQTIDSAPEMNVTYV